MRNCIRQLRKEIEFSPTTFGVHYSYQFQWCVVFLSRIIKHLGKRATILVLANLPLLATSAEPDHLTIARSNQLLKTWKLYNINSVGNTYFTVYNLEKNFGNNVTTVTTNW
jgi:hypothetical protein